MVIGGGPAGLMAAGQAALIGSPVLLLERTARLGAKLRLTGHGRCNLTNTAPLDAFLAHLFFADAGNAYPQFLRNALARFSASDLIAFLETLGVATSVERGGRVFAAGNDAHQVAEALVRFARAQGVQIRLRSRVAQLLHDDGRLHGVLLENGERMEAGVVVVATGGASYPRTGSTGDGYRLAAEMGHTIAPVRPALVPLVAAGSEPKAMMGVSLYDVEVRLLLAGQEVARATGDMLFTHYGVSGPAILTLSGPAVARLGQGPLEISINLKPALSPDELDSQLRLTLGQTGKRTFRTWLKALIPPKMVDVVVQRTNIPLDKPARQITAAERERLRDLLQDLRLTIVGHRSWDEAMVTAGGVDTREVDPRTLGSRLVAGLYFAGEVLNIQADTGGFNLQAAFSTGYVAGRAAAHFVADSGSMAAALQSGSPSLRSRAGMAAALQRRGNL